MPSKPVAAKLNIDAICDAILNGEMLSDIARSYGVSFAYLSKWISEDSDRSARAREARIAAAAAYEERAFDLIASAGDQFELARAKEMAHHLRWRASKINPRDYGDRQQVDVNGKMDVTLFDPDQAARMAQLAYATKPK